MPGTPDAGRSGAGKCGNQEPASHRLTMFTSYLHFEFVGFGSKFWDVRVIVQYVGK